MALPRLPFTASTPTETCCKRVRSTCRTHSTSRTWSTATESKRLRTKTHFDVCGVLAYSRVRIPPFSCPFQSALAHRSHRAPGNSKQLGLTGVRYPGATPNLHSPPTHPSVLRGPIRLTHARDTHRRTLPLVRLHKSRGPGRYEPAVPYRGHRSLCVCRSMIDIENKNISTSPRS